MSGGHFDYQQYRIGDIADTIERDIALALQPKPDMVHKDFWAINEMDSLHSYHPYCMQLEFDSYEKAKDFLLRNKSVEKAAPEYLPLAKRFFKEDAIFQSKEAFMKETKDGKRIPIMYSIYHCIYDHYPYDSDVLELTDQTLETMKEAYRQLKMAEIYANRVDWMISGDDSEESLQERLKEELDALDRNLKAKDWSHLEYEE